MPKLFTLFPFFLISTLGFSQDTIFYNYDDEIIMRALATHYRVGTIDVERKKFIGNVTDYWKNDSVMISLAYDAEGEKSGAITVKNKAGTLKLSGQYQKGNKTGIWKIVNQGTAVDFNVKNKTNLSIDSLEECLKKRESFALSLYIRKKEYPWILPFTIKPTNPQFKLSGRREEEIFTVVEVSSSFPNGIGALGLFIRAFLKYPEEAVKNNIKGQVIIEFTVMPDGSLNNFKVIKGIGYGCDEEAIRVLRMSPDWEPARQNGRAVPVSLQIPITF